MPAVETLPVTRATQDAPRAPRVQPDHVWAAILTAFGGAVLALAGIILWSLIKVSRPVLAEPGLRAFVTSSEWDPVRESFGALPFLYGTLVTSALGLLIALPVALGLALFLTELAPASLRRSVSYLIELLAGIPSVVYGLWGLFVLVPLLRLHVEPALGKWLGFIPLFRGAAIGQGYLAAGILLSLMILPTITSISIEVLRTVPSQLREAALALGATRWEAIRIAVLPYARAGILGATILGLGRALGETMAVTMVIGNSPTISPSLFAAGYTLPAVIANEFAEASGDQHLAALSALGLLLFGVTLILNSLARFLVRMVRRAA